MDGLDVSPMEESSSISRRYFARLAAFGVLGIPPSRARSADGSPYPILGKWIAQAPNGDRITYNFRNDDTVFWTVNAESSPGTVSAKYVIDLTSSPIHLDIFDFGLPMLRDAILLGILEFESSNRFRFFGHPQRLNRDTRRPTTFSTDTLVFTKAD